MMSRLHARGLVLCAAVLFVMAVDAKSADGDVTALLATIKAVGKEGEGNVAAAKAWQKLVEHGPQVLVPVLAGLDGANVRAANWIRLAVDAIAEKALETKQVDAKQLEAFIRDKSHSGRGRRLAFEILRQVDATSPDRLLPDMLDDPSSELRREAIARVITKIEKLLESANKAAALDLLKKIFPHTRDRDQVDLVADHLAKLGVQVDLQKHYGIVNRWYIATPFDNSGQKGFDIAYPPEKRVDLNATYEGKNGTKVQWKMVSTDDPRGLVDLNTAIGKIKGAVAYAYTVVESPREQNVQLRMGSNNAVKIFVNGKLIFFREEYHHGMVMDQYIAPCQLKAGKNEILLKVCQNEQDQPWAQKWSFQVRLCDELGGAVAFKVVPAQDKTPR